MQGHTFQKLFRISAAASIFLLGSGTVRAQAISQPAQSIPPSPPDPNVRALADSVRELQGQVQSLVEQLAELRAEELRDHAEAHELRQELAAREQNQRGAAIHTSAVRRKMMLRSQPLLRRPILHRKTSLPKRGSLAWKKVNNLPRQKLPNRVKLRWKADRSIACVYLVLCS
jgi:hypothetical protein